MGAAVLLLAVGVAVLGAVLFARALPLDVLGAGGTPGPSVVGTVPAGGSATIELDARRYVVWLAAPRADAGVYLDGDLTVTDPDGAQVRVRQGWLSGTSGRGGVLARTAAAFTADVSGPHQLRAPAVEGSSEAVLLVTPDEGPAVFIGGIFGTLGAVLGSLLLGTVGLGLTVGGAIWWYRRLHPPTPVAPR